MLKNILIVWNLVLTVALVLFVMNDDVRKTSYDIAQDTVLCGYITDLQFHTGIDRTLSPDCEGDVEKIHTVISN